MQNWADAKSTDTSSMDATIEERRRSRKYGILLLGATGYTGSLTAEHIARNLPTDLEWAIAGRSTSKLETLTKKLNNIDSKRSQLGWKPTAPNFSLGPADVKYIQ